ncbi:hypothetical protein PR048_029114 [Dryococelus australis]|uniref:DUF4371 domain-containing protein n=1 Tax=Dryococelus australis TaxID=614101 RepID=A0ABQ9GF34_9NEOP|nr:hypothetical protein PR048_029114 [Dryococelus australis]
MNKTYETQQMAPRTSLKIYFSSVQYLGRQGMAFRGHTEENNNLVLLNKLRNNISHDLRDIVDNVKSYAWFKLIVHESCNVSCREQGPVSSRIVEITNRHDLSKIINNVITSFGLSFSALRGQCYDGASNTKGEFRGVKIIIRKQQPLAIYVYCGNHSLNLALQYCVKNIPLLRDVLQTTNDIGVLLQSSPKRKALFSNICQDEVTGVNISLDPCVLQVGQYECVP